MKPARSSLIVSVISLSILVSTPATAQPNGLASYPSKPVRLVTSSPPATPPDVLARVIADLLAPGLGRPVIVDNRPGGSGTIGMNVAARAAPDGHTLGIISLGHMVAPGLVTNMPYDTARDLAPVTQLAWTGNVLIVRASSPLKSVADYVAAAKAKPGLLNYASAGNGTPSHLTSELFKRHAGIDVHHIPYKGITSGISAVLAGQVDIAFAGVATAAPLIKSGQLRALGTAAPQRLPAFPDLRTMSELGFSGFEVYEWQGIVATAGTPPGVIARLTKELARIIALPEFSQRLEPLGMEPVRHAGTEAFAALLRTELPRWTKLVREAGIRAD